MKNAISQSSQVQQDFGAFKGIFIAMFDPLINKNMLNMKADKL